MGLFLYVVVVLLVFAGLGGRMSWKRFRSPGRGMALGFFLGPIGLIIIALIGTRKGSPCVRCGAPLNLMWTKSFWTARHPVSARVCLACGAQQEAMPTNSPSAPSDR